MSCVVSRAERARVLQIHPTRRCNLLCAHCYSSSGPRVEQELPAARVYAVVAGARAEGFDALEVSGGEPFLYSSLPSVLRLAKLLGMTTSVVTNGTLLDEAHLTPLVGTLDRLELSLDGTPRSHAALRGTALAFSALAANLGHVHASGIPFGFVFTLMLHNLHEAEWVARFASECGAGWLRIQPLAVAGRGTGLLSARPDELENACAYSESLRLQRTYGARLRVQLGLSDRLAMRADPARVHADRANAPGPDIPLGSWLSPLVLESDGTLVPIQFGFPRAFALGNCLTNGVPALARHWKLERQTSFRALCVETFEAIERDHSFPFLDWPALLCERARSWVPPTVRAREH